MGRECHHLIMLRYVGLSAIVCLASILQLGDGYRILGVFPTPSISHQVVFRGLTLELNKRGHELVVVTTDPVNDPTLVNYTEIDISFGYDVWTPALNFIEARGTMNWIDTFYDIMYERYSGMSDRILGQTDLRKLYAPGSNQTFDLVMVEMLYWSSMYPLATRFDVPMIGVATLAPTININYEIGNPILSHDMSNWELETELSEQLSFWQRLRHSFTIWRFLYWYETTWMSRQDAIARKYFGNDIPDLNDLAKNISLLFVNQQRPISYNRPNVAKVIEIGGLHVSKKPTDMSKELKKILDGATEGFVYMSLGTNAKSRMLPKTTIQQFITAFSRLPYKVLWKFEDDVLPGKPDNVHVMKWVPQQAVLGPFLCLAHPNLKVFIYQGGVQSTEEAVHYAVPLVGLPVAFDQDMQIMKMVSLGVAKKLEIRAIDENKLFEAISTVATDTSYKQRMLDLRSLMHDKPQDPLETAVWWTEHVIRHRGAPQLHSASSDMPWYSRQDMDIVAFVSAGFVIVLGLTLMVLHQLVKRICFSFQAIKLDTKKSN